jgi:hypothetical protein
MPKSLSLTERLKIEKKLEKNKTIVINGQKAEYKNGLIYVEGSTGNFENPMTFDTYIHLYLTNMKTA